MQQKGVCHIQTAPCHPASNRLAERVVQSFKEGMQDIGEGEGSLETRLAKTLFNYHITSHHHITTHHITHNHGSVICLPNDGLEAEVW